jgi:hypothetical protein
MFTPVSVVSVASCPVSILATRHLLPFPPRCSRLLLRHTCRCISPAAAVLFFSLAARILSHSRSPPALATWRQRSHFYAVEVDLRALAPDLRKAARDMLSSGEKLDIDLRRGNGRTAPASAVIEQPEDANAKGRFTATDPWRRAPPRWKMRMDDHARIHSAPSLPASTHSAPPSQPSTRGTPPPLLWLHAAPSSSTFRTTSSLVRSSVLLRPPPILVQFLWFERMDGPIALATGQHQ